MTKRNRTPGLAPLRLDLTPQDRGSPFEEETAKPAFYCHQSEYAHVLCARMASYSGKALLVTQLVGIN